MLFSRTVSLALCLASVPGCGGSGSSAGGATPLPTATPAPAGSKARDVAARLGRPPSFLIGMGNDLENDHDQDGAYTLGVTLDLHYAYLVGLPGRAAGPTGTPVDLRQHPHRLADRHGVVPMFTLYSVAAWGEGEPRRAHERRLHGALLGGRRLLFQRLAVFGKPAVVHLEPDFWGFAQLKSGNPAALAVRVKAQCPSAPTCPTT